MKKVVFFITMFLCSLNIVDAANKIYSIDIDVYIDESGNANIEEVWTVDGSNGSEWYKVLGNLGNSKLENYTVSMDNTLLTYKSYWNVSGNLDSKKGYYGINNGMNGIELCFGKYDYEKHVFKLNYTLTNFVFNVSDAQVIYFNFIDRLSGVNFDDFSLEISTYYKLPNTIDVWGYGYNGYVYVNEGKIKMSNEKDMDNNYVVLLAKFPLNTFNTTNNYPQYNTFDDVYKIAEEGAQNKFVPYSNLFIIGVFVFFFASYFAIIFFINYMFLKPKLFFFIASVFYFIRKQYGLCLIFLLALFVIYIKNRPYAFDNGKRISKKNTPYFRDIPFDGDIFYANTLMKLNRFGYNKSNIIGALFLKWIKDGVIKVIKNEDGETVFNLEKNTINDNTNESTFYNMVYEASKNGVLEKNELKKWAKKYHSRYLNLFDRIELDGEYKLKNECHIYRSPKKWNYVMDETLYEDSKKLYGLKLFLNNFSNIKNREALDVSLWQEYLMYAYLFGSAKKVMKQFKNLYPEIDELMESNNINTDTVRAIRSISYGSISGATRVKNIKAAREASSYSSGGGGSSRRGGGGRSFGGGGGGSR